MHNLFIKLNQIYLCIKCNIQYNIIQYKINTNTYINILYTIINKDKYNSI